jgi:tRNA(fMet)-specific endonuclease VapC
MATTSRSVADRLAAIEKELADLKASLSQRVRQPWYRQIVGSFAGDPDFAEIIRLGRRIRRGQGKKK